MIKVDESDPVGELEPSFPFKDITIRKGVDMKEHYELQSEIGRGKFGTVFKCREKDTGLMLAAKFVGIVHKQDRRNVEREVEIMCELQHPRLIQLYDAFESNNAMCFILELVEGGELFERVIGDDFVLTEKAVTIFMRQICEGVQFIHSKNILHLDLKPENILCLTKTGNRIKIIDFGLARKFNPANKLQVLFGTPEFVAPEVVNFDAIGYGTDMWSVGVICYVLLSGLSPFMGETDVETMANVTIAQYDFDDEAFDSISNDAKDFIKKLLVKDHKSRLTATECLAHRWLQKKKPKKTVRKNSSKKLAAKLQQQTEVLAHDETTKQEEAVTAAASPDPSLLQLPLDVSKDNLKEFCDKSRSQSPVEIATAAPSLAQLRIQRDCRVSSKNGGNAGPRAGDQTTATTAVSTAVLLDSDEIANRPAVVTSSEQPAVVTSSGQPTVATSFEQPAVVTSSEQPAVVTSSGQPAVATSSEQPTVATSSGQTAVATSSEQPAVATSSGQSAATLSESSGDARKPGVACSAAVDIPSREFANSDDNRRTTAASAWSHTSTQQSTTNRRASDISYLFSSFQTTTTGFLHGSAELHGLSERLQDLQTMFVERDRHTGDVGGNLHRLLLNRQQLSAATDRRPKFKMSPMNRDVPFGSPPPASNLMYYMTTTTSTSLSSSAPHSKRASPEHESSAAFSAKEMLLKLFYGEKTLTASEPKLATT